MRTHVRHTADDSAAGAARQRAYPDHVTEGDVREGDEPDELSVDQDRDATPIPPIRRFRATATGSALAAMMSGLGGVLEPTKKEHPAVVVEHREPGDAFDDEPIVMRLDPDDPRDSIVLLRRHRMRPH